MGAVEKHTRAFDSSKRTRATAPFPPPKFFLPWIRRITPRRLSCTQNRPRGSNSKRAMGPLVRRGPLHWWRQALIGSRTAAACAYVPLFALDRAGAEGKSDDHKGPWLDAVETRVFGDGCIQSGGIKSGDLGPRSTWLGRPRHHRLASHGRAARRRSKIHPTSPGIRHFHVVVRRGARSLCWAPRPGVSPPRGFRSFAPPIWINMCWNNLFRLFFTISGWSDLAGFGQQVVEWVRREIQEPSVLGVCGAAN